MPPAPPLTQIAPGQQHRALALSTVAFTVCFAVWTIFSIIGVQIKQDLGLNETQFGLLIGTPILTGSLTRLFLGIWADQFGGRRVYTLVMLAAATATWVLTSANTYNMFLLAALGVGVAGGSFAVGVTYVSKWYPPGKQGTALGIFGSGNVGAAVTKFLAPFVMVAFGWQAVAQIWAAALGVIAVLFWLLSQEDPEQAARQQAQTPPQSFLAQLEPLKNLQVWRFSLYYFFVFGGFVALALWLPHYLIGVYGMDIKTAGMLAALYSLSASLFRMLGGYLSDRVGARTIMYWTLIAAVVCTFLLSYPPTDYVVHGIKGDIRFSMAWNVVGFVSLTAVLGFFMSLGKAAVYKHVPAYYPHNIGAVGGVVGMVGGLGGFLLPLTFGMLNDVTGIWQSCFMLLFVLVSGALVWMHFSIMQMDRRTLPETGAVSQDLPELASPSLVLTEWYPEDKTFWESTGKRIARRNLWISIPALLLAFAVWMVWSVVIISLPALGFAYSTNQLFWLAALPGLSGATLRIFYSFMVPIFGGRRWTTISTASLLLPALWIGFAVQNPETPYIVMLVLALLCGFGGGNFASSMANISFFYPQAQKGAALGMNAGLGNLGVSTVQFLVPLVITVGVFGALGGAPQTLVQDGASRQVWLQNAGFIWVPFILVVTVAAWFGMNDIASAKASFKDQAVIFKRKHNWIMCYLYTGTFGSFIGYSAALPLLIKTAFPDIDNPVRFAFLGPLVGALARPLGGWVADKLGGARVTMWNFVVMMLAVIGVLMFLPGEAGGGNFVGFLLMFLLLFATTGIGNGSTFLMIPAIFRTVHERAAASQGEAALAEARHAAQKESAAVLGFTSAIAAYGAFFIPKSFGTSVALTGTAQPALYCFVVFYLICIAVTWWYYARKNAEVPC
jgi:NNP family nitrate/nitrite transporter-like MFS transporter